MYGKEIKIESDLSDSMYLSLTHRHIVKYKHSLLTSCIDRNWDYNSKYSMFTAISIHFIYSH